MFKTLADASADLYEEHPIAYTAALAVMYVVATRVVIPKMLLKIADADTTP